MRFQVRRRILAAIFLGAVAAFWLLRGDGELPPREALAARLDALGPAALPVSVLLWAGASLLGFPGSLLVAASVWVFGFAGGVGVSVAGAMASASGAFWIARYLGREQLLEWLAERRRWRRLDEEIGRYGGRVVLLLRLLPSLPFTLLNYLLGLTRVGFGTYLLATMVGMLPHLVLFAFAADQLLLPGASGLPSWQKPGFWWAIVLAAVFLVALPLAVRLAARGGGNRWLGPLGRIR